MRTGKVRTLVHNLSRYSERYIYIVHVNTYLCDSAMQASWVRTQLELWFTSFKFLVASRSVFLSGYTLPPPPLSGPLLGHTRQQFALLLPVDPTAANPPATATVTDAATTNAAAIACRRWQSRTNPRGRALVQPSQVMLHNRMTHYFLSLRCISSFVARCCRISCCIPLSTHYVIS